jgi:hypothetical protein
VPAGSDPATATAWYGSKENVGRKFWTARRGRYADRSTPSRLPARANAVAWLTGANPNVYLEVGFALGRQRPTILVSAEDPRFDLQGQRCLRWRRIKDVEEMLTRDLRVLKEKVHIRLKPHSPAPACVT